MLISITLGWWLLPTFITLASFGWVLNRDIKERIHASQMFQNTTAIDAALWWAVYGTMYAAATIVSLVAWLIWALLK